ncbi:MAG TPA: hypothetical protein GX702_11395 [Chloroflexi bacterium]|jgi:hypothetical protein|nr:hypothetical protein [Chloroflexota bacterium]
MMTQPTDESHYILYYGRPEPPPERLHLRAGPLSLAYEHGDLRYIRLGQHEILRRLYVAIRDRNWNTAPLELSNLTVQQDDRSFRIDYDARNRLNDIDFRWRGHIVGRQDGTITCRMEGEALSTFMRNRIGFCVLHPMECAGVPCVVEHVDGSRTESAFPQTISPHQPFFDIRAISHQVAPNVWATVRMEGDTFEMEDQRNWTDASFKTYSTPLGLPFPVRIEKGTRIIQTVTISLTGAEDAGDIDAPPADEEQPVTLEIGEPTAPLPAIGLGLPSDRRSSSAREIERLRALRPAHLRLDLDITAPREAELERATREAREIGAPLEIALTLSDAAEQELSTLRRSLERIDPPVCRWLIFHIAERSTRPKWVDLARRHLGSWAPHIPFVIGTNAYFTELNRERPGDHHADMVCYSLNPQVHAFDDTSLVETLQAQAVTIDSARLIAGGRPLVISPITLRPRFNPNATETEKEGEETLPSQVDVRQPSLLAAGWTAMSIKYTAQRDVASVTYYETTGWRGVMEREEGTPLPDQFPSIPGSVYPLYHIMIRITEYAGGHVMSAHSTAPLRVDGLVLERDGRRRILVANLGPATEHVRLRQLPDRVQVRYLDERNAPQAMVDPEIFAAESGQTIQTLAGELQLSLLPYAVAWIDHDIQR